MIALPRIAAESRLCRTATSRALQKALKVEGLIGWLQNFRHLLAHHGHWPRTS
ncbi:hypothetical protein KEJ19_00090 [Candidatus Bathyarchaeota archaeon]|nr:hypothetical protein [Candidatus Bathyarchaeota archaeon]